jgi:hypothetical protein
VEIDPRDQVVRLSVYELLLDRGRMPSIAELASSLGLAEADIRESLERLFAQKAIALMSESREILMASPWSAVPTSYVVEAGGRSWWANCAWDGLAIPAAMGVPGKMIASCACCGEGMTAEVDGPRLLVGEGVMHIALPAKTWWNDIHFT